MTTPKTTAIDIDSTTGQLRTHLDRGGVFRFTQWFNKDGKSHSKWSSVDMAFVSPFKLDGRAQVFWGVHPTNRTVTESDRKKDWAKGKTDKEIEEFIGSKNDTIAAVNALYAEFDGKDFAQDESEFLASIPHYKALALAHIRSLPIKPSVIVDSGGGYQCYWLLAETYVIDSQEKRDFIKWLQAAWVEFVRGDMGAKDIRRILRVPGFFNIKPAYGPAFPIVSYIDADLDILYSIADFEELVPPRVITPVRQIKTGTAFNAQRNGNGHQGESVIDAFNAAYKIADVLQDCGYAWVGDRMAKPGGKNATVAVYEDDNQSFHHGGADPLCNGHRIDPFEAYAYYKHGGNKKAATKAAAEMLGMGHERDIYNGFHVGSPEEMALQTGAELAEHVAAALNGHVDDPTQTSQPKNVVVPPIVALLKKIDDAGNDAKQKSIAGRMPQDVRTALEGKLHSFAEEIADLSAHAILIADAIKRSGGYNFDDALLFVQTCVLTKQIGSERAKGFASIEKKVNKLRNMGRKFRLNLLEDNVEMDGQIIDDVSKSELYLYMDAHNIKKHETDDCLNVLAREDAYHPIRNYLNGLAWDGHDHITPMLNFLKGDNRAIDYKHKDAAGRIVGRLVTIGEIANDRAGIITAEDLKTHSDRYSLLHHVMILRWALGCVARAYEGDKATAFKIQTPMLVFVGGQGLGKSAWVRHLTSGVGLDYHRESPLDPHHQEHIRSAVTKWIWEVSELGSSLRRTDRDAIKGFLTQEWHTYRKPWGRGQITKPTLCNFVGTVNPETGFLDDPTGNRRYLPVHISHIDYGYKTEVDINQFWAHVVHLYKSGVSLSLTDIEKAALGETMEEHEVENPLQGHIQRLFLIDKTNQTSFTFTSDIIRALKVDGIALNANQKWAGREINEALAPLGLKREKRSILGIKTWGWVGIFPRPNLP